MRPRSSHILLIVFNQNLRLLAGAIRQQPVQAGRDIFFRGFAFDAESGRSIAVENQRCGNDLAEMELFQSFGCRAGENRKRNFLLLQKVRNLGLRLPVVQGHGKKHNLLPVVFRREFAQHRHFLAARQAPRCPEIQDKQFCRDTPRAGACFRQDLSA